MFMGYGDLRLPKMKNGQKTRKKTFMTFQDTHENENRYKETYLLYMANRK